MFADRLVATGTLALGASHAINNPLSCATINVEHVLRQLRVLLTQEALTSMPDVAEQVSALVDPLVEALEGVARIGEVVRNLMTFGQGTVEARTLVDVRSVLESSVQMALHLVVPRARLVRELGDVPPVEASEAGLGHVFLNLIVNAAQAIPEGDAEAHAIRVATHTDAEGNAIVEVGDTGVGIPPDGLTRVFDPFFTSKAAGESMGLGLSMSLGVIKSFGGSIHVSSEPAHGTVFRVVLPPMKGWRPKSAAAGGECMVDRTRILVVDGDAMVGAAIERSLLGFGDVEAITDARRGLDRLKLGERWDVILCDLQMSQMSGMDFYRETLRVAPDIAGCIVFVTAGGLSPKARSFLEGVRNPCLEKPLDERRLRNIIAQTPSHRPASSQWGPHAE